ncbi:MAG: hypothetical protein JW795_04045 [Chitinivibrionales bacterium]|nr:hypothetical protein [Chitinivibrionales bacterium]
MSTWKWCLYFIVGICLASATSFSQGIEAKQRLQNISLHGLMLGYCNNMEYFNEYREGQTLLGSWMRFWCDFQPSDRFIFSAGCHVRKEFGDSHFFSDSRPLLRVSFQNEGFTALIGILESTNRHGLSDALYREQAELVPGIEEGIEFLYQRPGFRQDLWMQWLQLNTPESLEHLIIGNSTIVSLGSASVRAMLIYDHHSGQQFAPPADEPRRETVNGSVQMAVQKIAVSVTDSVGVSIAACASSTTDTTAEGRRGGVGVARVWAVIGGFELSGLYSQGKHYFTATGNPLYGAQEPYFFIELKKRFTFATDCFIDVGGRLEWIDTKFDAWDGQHQMWVIMGGYLHAYDKSIR